MKSAGKARSSRRKTPSDSRGDALISEDASLVSDKEKEKEKEKEYEKENDHENEKEEDLKDLSQEYVCVSKENAPMRADTQTRLGEKTEGYGGGRRGGAEGDCSFRPPGPGKGEQACGKFIRMLQVSRSLFTSR